MIRNGQQGTAAAAWCGRLLLLSALLLGIVTMHTLGHPTGHAGKAHAAATEHARTGHARTRQEAGAHAAAGMHAQQAHAPSPGPTAEDGQADGHGIHAGGGQGVLGGGALPALVLLLVTAALRRPAAAPAALRARLLRALWPIPPPPRHKSLARLSVLRV
ncbi:hypothetical protein [Streptomyces sp. URMC 124]|uniref:hypothetical protein n=1 Tax=Streptomyces sp. URMC 124 TaxID=3423405 RepID=UPI003F1C9A2B